MKLDRRLTLVWLLVLVVSTLIIAAVAVTTDAHRGPTDGGTDVQTEEPPSTEADMVYPRDHPCDGERYPKDGCPPLEGP